MNIGLLDVGLGISAAGTTQATAQLVINALNEVTTAATGSGVILKDGVKGAGQIVFNGAANAFYVYPPVGYAINGLPANTPHLLVVGSACQFWIASSTRLIGLLGA